ncbi:hypothetical protein C1645_833800 [Glomus cerebriforme]|uniref:Uncharacterized protein n=1 Tax=Glomus cerebriforme TaxID=658196 RepID=A0A397SGX4_9GLOM|nr:hypothetical protein C1645_833800 [Glomus cerebriforme]
MVRITPTNPSRTPEHQIFFSNSFISPITRSKSDDKETDNDFDADNKDFRNLTFDEYIDGDDVNNNDLERVFLDDSITFDESGKDNSKINISALFSSYHVNIYQSQTAQESDLSIETDYCKILSLSHILLLQADNFSDLQIQEFFQNTLEQLQKNMRNFYAVKIKVPPNVKALYRTDQFQFTVQF